jgi:UDP-N-acetylmuramate dehydrogenase
MISSDLIKDLKTLDQVKIFKNEPLSRHTTMRIGGPADLFITPYSLSALKEVISLTKGLKRYILGNGSNFLAPDKGIKGIVIQVSGWPLNNNIIIDGRSATVGAGVLLQSLIRKLNTCELSGLEFAAGIPAALGGAVTMNMGALGNEMADIVEYAEVIDASGHLRKLSGSDIKFAYRKSNIKDCIVYSVCLKLKHRASSKIKETIQKNMQWRKESQPINVPSAGSVFKNPKDVPAGKLIDMAGLKGLRCGDAEVSKKHANFIINLGDAKSSDVLKLTRRIKNAVKDKFKVRLELELIDSLRLNMLS